MDQIITYQFVTGPLAWASFMIFFAGMLIKIVSLVSLARKKDKVIFDHFSWKWSIKSIIMWFIPFGSRSMREKPMFTVVSFVFHTGLVFTPIFLLAHNILLKERWGISLYTISDSTADLMTILVILGAIFIVLRRIALPDVRILTSVKCLMILAITVTPFITGFIAFHQFSNYNFWLIVHIISGEIMLISIPFTRLSHIFLFFMTKAHLASEFGTRRKCLSW